MCEFRRGGRIVLRNRETLNVQRSTFNVERPFCISGSGRGRTSKVWTRFEVMNLREVGRALRSAPETSGSETVVCGALGEVALPDGSGRASVRRSAGFAEVGV